MNMRAIKNKAAVLVLLWTFLPFATYFGVLTLSHFLQVSLSLIIISTVSLPIVGCLSDVCFGRYKTIRFSLRMLWVSLIAFNVFLIIKQYTASEHETTKLIVAYIIGGCVAISICGILANTLQFGIDQLTDASSSDICSYISWYIWTIAVACTLDSITDYCFCGAYNHVIGFFFLPLLSTGMIISDIYFNKWLVKEPATSNPFKLIFQVLRYAVKNKYERKDILPSSRNHSTL